MNNYADVLESYLIPADEGFMDKVKSAGKYVFVVCKRIFEAIKELIKTIISKLNNLLSTFNGSAEQIAERITNTKGHQAALDFQKFTALVISTENTGVTIINKIIQYGTKFRGRQLADISDEELDNVDELLGKLPTTKEGKWCAGYLTLSTKYSEELKNGTKFMPRNKKDVKAIKIGIERLNNNITDLERVIGAFEKHSDDIPISEKVVKAITKGDGFLKVTQLSLHLLNKAVMCFK